MNNGLDDDIHNKIDLAQVALDRTLGLISGCDNKTSIILAIVGVISTILFTEKGLGDLHNILVKLDICGSVGAVMYLCLFVALVGIICIGLFHLILVLCAKVEISDIQREGVVEDSKFFFGSISSNKDFYQYKEKFSEMTKEQVLEDLLSQNYINSIIASEKYKNYNFGLKWTTGGIFGLIILLIIGMHVF